MDKSSFYDLLQLVEGHDIFHNDSQNPQAPVEIQLAVALDQYLVQWVQAPPTPPLDERAMIAHGRRRRLEVQSECLAYMSNANGTPPFQ
ncbi:hypothetical protein R1sor_002661 [Riccia sorocarpa]|uniref:Uncharacterized protein n=1 Tax=Riccia sorocarpa TaxID=122646 RepID=A0ABD3H3D4_9MARC